MSRKLRIEYPGAMYHVMNRGDQREDIFRDDDDRQKFLFTLGETCTKTEWQVHAYCLMRNHFHLVLETPQQPAKPGCSGVNWTAWLLRRCVARLCAPKAPYSARGSSRSWPRAVCLADGASARGGVGGPTMSRFAATGCWVPRRSARNCWRRWASGSDRAITAHSVRKPACRKPSEL